jgi:hypothetical protein
MQIEVVVTGNRSLYRSIYESIDRTTLHRTATGAARSIMKVEADAKSWARSCGKWGSYTIHIDGIEITRDEDAYLMAAVDGAIADRRWADPVQAIAKAIESMRDAE